MYGKISLLKSRKLIDQEQSIKHQSLTFAGFHKIIFCMLNPSVNPIKIHTKIVRYINNFMINNHLFCRDTSLKRFQVVTIQDDLILFLIKIDSGILDMTDDSSAVMTDNRF